MDFACHLTGITANRGKGEGWVRVRVKGGMRVRVTGGVTGGVRVAHGGDG